MIFSGAILIPFVFLQSFYLFVFLTIVHCPLSYEKNNISGHVKIGVVKKIIKHLMGCEPFVLFLWIPRLDFI